MDGKTTEDVSIDNITSVEIEMIRQFRLLDGESQAWITKAMKYAFEFVEKS